MTASASLRKASARPATKKRNAADEFELLSCTLSDFTVKPIGPNAVVVTYIARYEGKSAGQVSKGKSVFGEVWIRQGHRWKDLYRQETYVK